MDGKRCSTCGVDLNSENLKGLCPACLMKIGMSGPTEDPLSCAVCQSPLSEGARFCSDCGAAVSVALLNAGGDQVRAALEAKLRGQYRFIRLLGQGGMGEVYLARDLTLDREVAIKIIRTASNHREVYDRFRKEAKIAAKLAHPNIVPLHAFGEVEGVPYFVMGYVRGESLATRLRRDGKLSEEEGRRVLAEIADALDHAHRQGVVHRDIKPDNVLLEDESGRALLTDFGVAKAQGHVEALTRSGSVIGTPQYMSPEQAAGRADLDGRSDLYSLGVMGYAVLTGRLPFEGKSAPEILTKHLTQQPPALQSLAPTISDTTVQAVQRCLSKDPSQRWPDARSLKLALGAIEEDHLPEALQDVQGIGILGTLYVWASMYLMIVLQMKEPSYELGGFIYTYIEAGFAGSALLIYSLVLARLRRNGFSVHQSQKAIWTEPAWWPLWYPNSLRRRGNVWQRLPTIARSVRGMCTFVFLFMLICIPACIWLDSYSQIPSNLIFFPPVAFLCAMALFWFILIGKGRRELRQSGLGPADVNRILISVPAARISFWTRPHIAAILAPAKSAVQAVRSDSPHEQLQSILRHANELTGLLRPLGTQASVAARQLLASIDSIDKEITELARNLEPGEEERLRDKIAAMAPAEGQSDEYAPMRLLLEKQVELVCEINNRIEKAKDIRARRIEILKTLTLHVMSLHARSVEAPAEIPSLSERVRAICDEIQAWNDSRSNIESAVNEMETISRNQ